MAESVRPNKMESAQTFRFLRKIIAVKRLNQIRGYYTILLFSSFIFA